MANDKDFEGIMTEITAGLTGDSDKDIQYLKEQSEKYKNHEYGKEILRACGRLIYQSLPDEKKKEIGETFGNIEKGFEATLDEVRFNIYEKRYDTALKLIESTIAKYEKLNMYENDAVSEYFCFREPMEKILYREYNDPEKDIRQSQVDYAEMYLVYGSLLVELKRLEDAEKALEKARRWNPAYAKLAFEYAETFKMRGLIDDFARITRETFKYAYRPKDLARCYRNMGYYLVEKEEYKAAICCLLLSGNFEKSEIANSELYYISQKIGEMYNPSEEEMDNLLEEHEIPFGPKDTVLQVAYSYGMHFFEAGDMQTAGYFLSIVGVYIEDEELNETLRIIKEKLNS